MENNIKSELMYRLSDYIGTFATLDALRPGMILPGHVQSFLGMERYWLGIQTLTKTWITRIVACCKHHQAAHQTTHCLTWLRPTTCWLFI